MSDSTIIDDLTWDNFIKNTPLNYEGHTIKVGDNYYKSVGGVWVLQITWTNCAEQMPPDDDDLVIVNIADRQVTINTCVELGMFCKPEGKLFKVTKWATYTPEKWKELNNERD